MDVFWSQTCLEKAFPTACVLSLSSICDGPNCSALTLPYRHLGIPVRFLHRRLLHCHSFRFCVPLGPCCAYARAGLDPVAREWCRFLTPERLSLHPKHGGDGGHDGGRGGSDVRTNGGGTPRLAFSSCSSPAEDSLRGAALSGGGSPSETLHSPARSVASDKSSRGQGSARCNSGRKWTSNR
eukprot:1464768-Pleurochrysis_carterae.AAC.1